jgi:hypothetical protein
MTADTNPGYLDEAARLLRGAATALDRIAEVLRLAEGYTRLAAIQRDIAPDGPAPDARLAAVLRFATYASTAVDRISLEWIIDQMVRAATGCPEDPTVAGLGTSPAYERFRAQVGEWSEGMAP